MTIAKTSLHCIVNSGILPIKIMEDTWNTEKSTFIEVPHFIARCAQRIYQ